MTALAEQGTKFTISFRFSMDKRGGLLYNKREVSLLKKALLVFCLSAAVICCCVLLAACSSQDGFERTAQQFFSALENRDYDTIYSLMTPSSEAAISREKLGEVSWTI